MLGILDIIWTCIIMGSTAILVIKLHSELKNDV